MNTLEKNKIIVKNWFDTCWRKHGDISMLDELIADNIVVVSPMQGLLKGKETVRQFLIGVYQAFPDLYFDLTIEPIAEKDYVVVRFDGGGTHTGIAMPTFTGGPLPTASQKKVKFTGTIVYRIENNKIIEEITEEGWGQALYQLGIISIPYPDLSYDDFATTRN